MQTGIGCTCGACGEPAASAHLLFSKVKMQAPVPSFVGPPCCRVVAASQCNVLGGCCSAVQHLHVKLGLLPHAHTGTRCCWAHLARVSGARVGISSTFRTSTSQMNRLHFHLQAPPAAGRPLGCQRAGRTRVPANARLCCSAPKSGRRGLRNGGCRFRHRCIRSRAGAAARPAANRCDGAATNTGGHYHRCVCMNQGMCSVGIAGRLLPAVCVAVRPQTRAVIITGVCVDVGMCSVGIAGRAVAPVLSVSFHSVHVAVWPQTWAVFITGVCVGGGCLYHKWDLGVGRVLRCNAGGGR